MLYDVYSKVNGIIGEELTSDQASKVIEKEYRDNKPAYDFVFRQEAKKQRCSVIELAFERRIVGY